MLFKPVTNSLNKPRLNFIVKYCTLVSSIQSNDTCQYQINLPETETKLLKVGIIGVPNAGKSTFINNLVDRKVCPTSSKVHTTRSKSRAIFTEGDAQIVFLDTPGLVSEQDRHKFKLENTFVRDKKVALQEADIVGVIHDSSNAYTRDWLDIKVIKMLEKYKEKKSFLVLNKIDILKSKRKLLDLARLLTENCVNGVPVAGPKLNRDQPPNKEMRGWPYFQDIFMVSSLTGDGLRDVKQYLIDNAKPAKWMFPDNVWTDQAAENIIENAVKAKLLDFLPQEIPYLLSVKMEYFNINSQGVITAAVLVKTPSVRVSRLVAGSLDGRLKQIMQSVRDDLQSAFKNAVKIKIIMDPPASSEGNTLQGSN